MAADQSALLLALFAAAALSAAWWAWGRWQARRRRRALIAAMQAGLLSVNEIRRFECARPDASTAAQGDV